MGGRSVFPVRNPYSGDVVATVSHRTPEQVEDALARAWACRTELAALPGLHERLDEFAATITAESGKPIRWARTEVERAALTVRRAAEEAVRWSGGAAAAGW